MDKIKQKFHYILPIWIILISITICHAQDTLYVPDFSVQRGFYESPFSVIITSDREDASIVYTFDGSDPTTSQNAFTETSPAAIYIDPDDETGRFTAPGVVLRAIASKEGFEPSRIVTHTYLFLNKIKDAFIKRVEELELGGEEFLAKIADETNAATEEEVLEFITKANHPVTTLEPMF